jgi:hypothetical protein
MKAKKALAYPWADEAVNAVLAEARKEVGL